MNTQQRRHLTTRNATQTQALYGRSVYILAKQGGWDEVAVPGQPTPKNPWVTRAGWRPGSSSRALPTRQSSSGGSLTSQARPHPAVGGHELVEHAVERAEPDREMTLALLEVRRSGGQV
jgi:hypothetical protein